MRKITFTLALTALLTSCGEEGPKQSDSFDRKAVVTQVVDEMILPSYTDLSAALTDFKSDYDAYLASGSSSAFEELKESWLDSYLAWQDAAMWNFGPAEDNGLLSAMNIYPTDTAQILQNIEGTYDLYSIGQIDAQGFPAMEFLLYDSTIDWSDVNVTSYFDTMLSRMINKLNATQSEWTDYRSTFINAEGTDRGSALGILFNHSFLPYLEVHIREAKFGIPGGQRTGTALPYTVEGRYSRNHSRELASRAFAAYRRAWLGMGHVSHNAGPAVIDYVKYMDDRNGTQLNGKLQEQLDEIQLAIDALDADFYGIAETNPQQLNDVWVKQQLMVFTIKTEISSALNVTISYVDSDGD